MPCNSSWQRGWWVAHIHIYIRGTDFQIKFSWKIVLNHWLRFFPLLTRCSIPILYGLDLPTVFFSLICLVAVVGFCFGLFSGLHWRLQNTFVEDSVVDTSRFCPPLGALFLIKTGCAKNRCEHEFAFNFDLSIQLTSMPFPVHQWMQGWFRLALKAERGRTWHGLALRRKETLKREAWKRSLSIKATVQ